MRFPISRFTAHYILLKVGGFVLLPDDEEKLGVTNDHGKSLRHCITIIWRHYHTGAK